MPGRLSLALRQYACVWLGLAGMVEARCVMPGGGFPSGGSWQVAPCGLPFVRVRLLVHGLITLTSAHYTVVCRMCVGETTLWVLALRLSMMTAVRGPVGVCMVSHTVEVLYSYVVLCLRTAVRSL